MSQLFSIENKSGHSWVADLDAADPAEAAEFADWIERQGDIFDTIPFGNSGQVNRTGIHAARFDALLPNLLFIDEANNRSFTVLVRDRDLEDRLAAEIDLL